MFKREAMIVLDVEDTILWIGVGAGAIDDDPDAWDVLSKNRERIQMIVHTHPGSGPPAPSPRDLLTFKIMRESGFKNRWGIMTAGYFLDTTSGVPLRLEDLISIPGCCNAGEWIDVLYVLSSAHTDELAQEFLRVHRGMYTSITS